MASQGVRPRAGIAANTSGTALTEFALILPTLLFLILGGFELTQALSAKSKIDAAADGVAEVISRDVLVDNTELATVFAAARLFAFPLDGAGMRVRITSLQVKPSGRAEVVWSEARGGEAPLAAGSVYDLPAEMLDPGAGIIMVDVAMPYRMPLGFLRADLFTIEKTQFRRARLADPVRRT